MCALSRSRVRRSAVVAAVGLGASLTLQSPGSAASPPGLSVSAPINVSQSAGNQMEASVAIDPTNHLRIFALGRDETGNLISARSSDGGSTWVHAKVGTGAGGVGLPSGWGNTSVAFDAFGNLFVTYLGSGPTTVVDFAVSTDGGATFTQATSLGSLADQPVVATGPGSVWVTYDVGGVNWVRGASVTGLGLMGSFGVPEEVVGANGYGFGDIAVSPSGVVMVAFGPTGSASGGAGQVLVSRDADGLGPAGFEATPVVAATTNVGGFTFPPAAPNWGIDSEAHVVWDHSGGTHEGRAYLSYLDSSASDSADTDLMIRHSDDGGSTWSAATKVNDDVGNATQMMPAMGLDQTTGALALTWFDTRDDSSRLTVRYYMSVSDDGGQSWSPNVALSPGSSDQAGAVPPVGTRDTDFGDYTGAAFLAGHLVAAWPDNSDSTADNPAGAGSSFDLYVGQADVTVPDTIPPSLAPSFSAAEPFLRGASGITASPNATDASGIASSSCDPVDTATAGAKVLTCRATDNAGNPASVLVGYVVGFGFTGVAPADGTSFRRTASIPVAFKLTDATGPLTDAESAGLASAITVAFDSQGGVHPSWAKKMHQFTVSLKTGKPATGAHTVGIDVVSAGVTLAHLSIPVVIV